MKPTHLAAAVALAAATLGAQAQTPQYSITELGISAASAGASPSSLSSSTAAISSSGNYVIGRSLWQTTTTPSALYGPNYTWSAGSGMVDWNMPTGRFGPTLLDTGAVNNNGVAVASLATGIGNQSLAPYMWSGSTVTALALPSGQVSARVADINDSGKAVGQAGSGLTGMALMYDTSNPSAAPTTITAVTGTFSATSTTGTTYTGVASMTAATQINNAGQVVGTGYLAGATQALVPLLYNSNTNSLSFIDLTSLGGVGNVQINGLSENGWVVGTYNNIGFRWKEGVGASAIPLPTGASGTILPYAINSSGQVVGKAGSSTSAQLFYFDGSSSYSLNSMIAGNNPNGWSGNGSSPTAFGIADNGSIIVSAISNSVSGQRALLLSPVPEPSTWALMLAGIAGVGAIARRRKAAA